MSGDTFGPEVDPAMAIVSNRLPYMDLNEFIAENNFAYFITWRAWAFDELRIDDQQAVQVGVPLSPAVQQRYYRLRAARRSQLASTCMAALAAPQRGPARHSDGGS